MKISWNAHDQRTLWHSDWQLNCQICLFYVYCTSKLDFYILDAPVSNRLIIKQEVSECLNISIVVEHTIPFTSFETRYLKVLWIHLVVWWLVHNYIIYISNNMASVIRCTYNSLIKLRFSDFQWLWKPLESQ